VSVSIGVSSFISSWQQGRRTADRWFQNFEYFWLDFREDHYAFIGLLFADIAARLATLNRNLEIEARHRLRTGTLEHIDS
jgi:hypothetical protein